MQHPGYGRGGPVALFPALRHAIKQCTSAEAKEALRELLKALGGEEETK